MPEKLFGVPALSTIAPAVIKTLYETPNNIFPAGLIVTLSSLGKIPSATFALLDGMTSEVVISAASRVSVAV